MSAGDAPIEVFTLTDGGQSAEQMARRVAGFIAAATSTLELALYDVRLPDPTGSIVAEALRAASGRGVRIRLLYNTDTDRPAAIHPPPATRPEILAELPIEARGVPGIPDLMHHKYAVRDSEAVWSGSTNWTVDSWTRQENAVITVASAAGGGVLPARTSRSCGGGGRSSAAASPTRTRSTSPGRPVRAWFTPGHGEALSARIAEAIKGPNAGPDRLTGDHLGARPRRPGGDRERGRGGRRRRRRRAADRPRLRAVAPRQRRLEDPAAGDGALTASVLRQAFDARGAPRRSTTSCTPRSRSPTTPSSSAPSTSPARESRTPRTCSSSPTRAGRADGGLHRPGQARYPASTIPALAAATISSGSSA